MNKSLHKVVTFRDRLLLIIDVAHAGTVADFARANELFESTLSRYIKNDGGVRKSTLLKVEALSGWSAEWLLNGSLPAISRADCPARTAVQTALKVAIARNDEAVAEAARYLLGDVLPSQANAAAPASTDTLSETARALKAQGDNLMPPLEQIEEPVFPRQQTLTIPYYDIPVNAGQAVPLDIAPPTLLVFDYVSYKNPNKLFGVLVSGDSMIGVGIVNRSRLICERTEDVERAMDRVVIACTQDGTVVKLLTRNQEGRPVLRSDNPAKDYPDIMVDETVRIQAIVVKALNDI